MLYENFKSDFEKMLLEPYSKKIMSDLGKLTRGNKEYSERLALETCSIDFTNTELKARFDDIFQQADDKADAILKSIKNGGLNDFYTMSPVSGMAVLEACSRLTKEEQARKAKNPRPKKEPTIKSLVMDEMRIAKNKSDTFNEFMETALNDNIEQLLIEVIGGDKFKLSIGDVKGTRSKKTLMDWWSDCIK